MSWLYSMFKQVFGLVECSTSLPDLNCAVTMAVWSTEGYIHHIRTPQKWQARLLTACELLIQTMYWNVSLCNTGCSWSSFCTRWVTAFLFQIGTVCQRCFASQVVDHCLTIHGKGGPTNCANYGQPKGECTFHHTQSRWIIMMQTDHLKHDRHS